MDRELELWEKYGGTQKEKSMTLGPHASYQWNHSRRHLLFSAARYKFAMKMIGSIYEPGKKELLDLGCSDGFGTYYIAEYAKSVLGVDFDAEAVWFAKENIGDQISFRQENFLNQYYGLFDGIVSFDVLEHIYPENEAAFMNTVIRNLKKTGTFVVGTPSLESQQFAKENISGAHVNIYRGEELYTMLKQYFYNVYLFTQNDEIIHTGHLRMANYLIAVCTHQKGEKQDE